MIHCLRHRDAETNFPQDGSSSTSDKSDSEDEEEGEEAAAGVQEQRSQSYWYALHARQGTAEYEMHRCPGSQACAAHGAQRGMAMLPCTCKCCARCSALSAFQCHMHCRESK